MFQYYPRLNETVDFIKKVALSHFHSSINCFSFLNKYAQSGRQCKQRINAIVSPIHMVNVLFPYHCLANGYKRKGAGRQTIFCVLVFYNLLLSKIVAMLVKSLAVITLCLARPQVRGLGYLCHNPFVSSRKAFLLFHSLKKQ